MSNIQISLNSLIKSNNGFFKSEKQAKFLLSVLKENNVFANESYGNIMLIQYDYDDKGITLKTKTSQKTGKNEKIWGRKIEGVLSIDEQQIVKRLNKQLKATKKSYQAALKAYNEGSYFNSPNPENWEIDIYNNSRSKEISLINKIEASLAKYI